MTPKNLTQEQTKLLDIHDKKNHCVPIKEIEVMAKMGIFDSRLASCQPPECVLCMFGCAHKKPWRVKGKEKHLIRSKSEMAAGDKKYLNALTSITPGVIPQLSGFLISDCFWAATVFVDHATSYMYTNLQRGQTQSAYERMARTFGIIVKKFQTENGIFAEEGFKRDVSDKNQPISYCGFRAHYQNGIAEAYIKQPTEKARTMLIHAKNRWWEVIQPCLWPFALKQAEFNLNNLCLGKSGKSRAENFSVMHNKINIRHYHTFGCPVYVINARLQGAGFIQKWDKQARVGAFVRRSPIHAGNVSPILNLSMGHSSPQFHVVFDETFSTVPSLKNGSIPASWTFICENHRELATYKDFNLADLWSKSERESGVKFDIQRDSNSKSF